MVSLDSHGQWLGRGGILRAVLRSVVQELEPTLVSLKQCIFVIRQQVGV